MSAHRASRTPGAWKRVRWRLQAAALALLWRLLRWLPLQRAAVAGAVLMRACGPLTRRHIFVLRNIECAFPALCPHEHRALARAAWANFGAVLAEYPHLGRFRAAAGGAVLALRVAPGAEAILTARRPAVYVAAHLANWELAGVALARLGVPLSVIYAPQGNPFVERQLQALRAAIGCRFIGKRHALRRVLAELAAGRSVGLLCDQRSDAGEPTPFFGLPAQTATTPALLAARTGCPMVPVQVERLAHGGYAVTLHEALAVPEATPAGVRRATAALNRLYEAWIRQRPDQWLCMRRRWPRATVPRVVFAEQAS